MVLLLIGAALAGLAFWIGPFRPVPAELRLLVQQDSLAADSVALANAGTADAPRFALVLALQNQGGRVARPERVDLSVPAFFRLRSSGEPLRQQAVAGNPLVRYRVPISAREIPPDGTTQPLAAGDTLWLEPVLPDYYCTTLADSVPEFVPAPARSASQLADLRVFYSFRDARPLGRQTGLLRLQLDSTALRHTPAAQPPSFAAVTREPEIPRPELGTLREGGHRTAQCGDPQQPLELYTKLWETAAGGRFMVVYVSGAPRKQLFDLNRDSIIELEMWDPDGDGRYESARPARYPIPPFLLPERTEVVAVASMDSLATDAEWQRRFADTAAGPFRFVPDSALPEALRPARVAVDTAWLRKFHDVAAGPYRFAQNPPARLVKPPPPRPRGPVPLGTPIPYPPPGRRDTIPR